ncbi:histone-lysine N-methyltransferase [Fusarium albosuccineum]|uniref:Histone-lysine N-methyltransferase n=1 Tax=Fusarium albosuccineum TaxID=1237068 RepID=A0A8H4L2L5_9HYPO|nr:histone-lysine N-methyltransferase [Fusarium albosuccineum]
MADEAPKPEPAADIPQVAAPFDAGANGLPAHAVQAEALQKDIVMSDAPLEQPAGDRLATQFFHTSLPTLLRHSDSTPFSRDNLTDQREMKSSPAPAAHAPSPVPARTGTPAQGSRAASAHPDPGFNIPAEAPPHGDSTRRYLNTKVTGVLLEGMKQLAKDKYETTIPFGTK